MVYTSQLSEHDYVELRW